MVFPERGIIGIEAIKSNSYKTVLKSETLVAVPDIELERRETGGERQRPRRRSGMR